MNFLFNTLILLIYGLFSTMAVGMLSSSESLDDDSLQNLENTCPNSSPQKVRIVTGSDGGKLVISIKLNPNALKETVRVNAGELQAHSGFTPKGKPQSLMTGSPLLNVVNPRVLIKRNRETLEDIQEDIQQEDIQEDTQEDIQVELITSRDSNFCNGHWAFLDAMLPKSCVAIDCDFPALKEVAHEIALSVTEANDQPAIIAKIIHKIHTELDRLAPALFHQEDESWVCRHFAVLTASVMAHLLQDEHFVYEGFAHILGADSIAPNLREVTDGHAWNFIHFISETDEFYVFLDVFNKAFCIFKSRTEALNKMHIYRVNIENRRLVRGKLENDEYFYDWARCTKRHFLGSTKSLEKYNCPEKRKLLALKVARKFKLPPEHVLVPIK